jgi:hypothetical protein
MKITIFAITGDPLPTAWELPDWPTLANFITTDEFRTIADRAASVTIRGLHDEIQHRADALRQEYALTGDATTLVQFATALRAPESD